MYPTKMQVVSWLLILAYIVSFVVTASTSPEILRLFCSIGISPYENSNGSFKFDLFSCFCQF
jgi:hypothetical protein